MEGNDQNTGYFRLKKYRTAQECLVSCKIQPNATACEYHNNGNCLYHTMPVGGGNEDSDYDCWVLEKGNTTSHVDYLLRLQEILLFKIP